MKKNKVISLTAGLAVGWACVFSCFSEPTPVYADAGNFAGAVDYILAASGDEAVALTSGGGAAVSSALMMVYLCTRNPLPAGGYYDADSLTVVEGLYKYNDETHLGYEWFTSNANASSDAPMVFATAKDFEISVTGPFKNYNSSVSYNNYFSIGADLTSYSLCQITNAKDNGLFTSGLYTPRGTTPNYYVIFGGSLSTGGGVRDWDRYPTTDLSTIFTTDPVNASNVIWIRYRATPPTGQIDPANPDVYIENVLRPWVVENYPEYIYLLPDPEPQPTETLDPSETMPGLPVIQLPTVPPPEYDLELPEKMIEGTGFWFTALTEVLEEMGWLAVVIVLAVIAIVLYYVF